MRDVKALHPDLQLKIEQLIKLCAAQGIVIGISECVRSVAEQDALYAKGRTKPGKKVTNAKGKSYNSMHQWGVAFDFYLNMDVDGDGQSSDDAFNNSTSLFNKVGKIGQSIGLEWGGSWKKTMDLPHFQLPNWGSTPTLLKKRYGTPDAFKKTWEKAEPVKPKPQKIDAAKLFDKKLAKGYKANCNCHLWTGPTGSAICKIAPKEAVRCFGYYTDRNGKRYLAVQYKGKNGFVLATNFD